MLFTIVAGCTKGSKEFCWELVDQFGNLTGSVCNKTEAEMQRLYPSSCSYYKTNGEKFCWLIGQTFLSNSTVEKANYYSRCFGSGATPTKVECNYCGRWYHRIKRTYKPTNTFVIYEVKVEQFCGDTAKTLYQGRQIILKDTPDSLIVRQFSNNGTNW